MEAPGEAEEPRMIFEAHRDGIADADPAAAEKLGDLVRAPVELGIRDRLTARRHDDGGLVRICARVNRRVHDLSTVSRASRPRFRASLIARLNSAKDKGAGCERAGQKKGGAAFAAAAP